MTVITLVTWECPATTSVYKPAIVRTYEVTVSLRAVLATKPKGEG